LFYLCRHLTTLDDALIRMKWMNCRKAISEEVEVVKQLDAQLKSLKEAPRTRRTSSPPIRSNKSFVFQPLDEYPTSSPSPFDDPDVWAPPPRDTPNRRSTRGQSSTRKSSQDVAWAHGPSKTGTPSRSAKPSGSKGSTATRSSAASATGGRKGKSASSKADSAVISVLNPVFSSNMLCFCS
jgi:katanin p60 ATPase-containing subunit A1